MSVEIEQDLSVIQVPHDDHPDAREVDRARFEQAVKNLEATFDDDRTVSGCALGRCMGRSALSHEHGDPAYPGALDRMIQVGTGLGFTEYEAYDIASGWDFGDYGGPGTVAWGPTRDCNTEARALGAMLRHKVYP